MLQTALTTRRIVLVVSTTLLALALLNGEMPAWARLAAVVVGIGLLLVRGSWADVLIGVLAVLLVAGIIRALLPGAPLAEAAPPVDAVRGAIRLSLPADKTTAPPTKIAVNGPARVVISLSEKDLDDSATRTFGRLYHVHVRVEVPTGKLSTDVLVDYQPSTDAAAARFVNDVNTASSIAIFPAR